MQDYKLLKPALLPKIMHILMQPYLVPLGGKTENIMIQPWFMLNAKK